MDAISISSRVPHFPTSTEILFVLVTICSIVWVIRYSTWKYRPQGPSLPPGPKGLPLFGNLMDIPKVKHPWVVYQDWASRYGDIVFVQAFNTRMLIISSPKVAYDLMDRRSRIYSSRPPSVMDALTGWEFNVGLMPYGQKWRDTRRLVHQYFNQFATRNHRQRQLFATRAFLHRCIENPGNLTALAFRHTLASAIMDVVFSIKVNSMENEHLHTVIEALKYFEESKGPKTAWVEMFPLLRYIPAWLPGGVAQNIGNRARQAVERLRNKPFNMVKDNQSLGNCMALDLIRKIEHLNNAKQQAAMEECAKDATGVIYPAAIDTTTSLLSFFVCAMAMHPEIQVRAQRQLDEVVGSDRLPDFDDYDSLSYIRAILLESIRWIPVAPLGIPHSLTTDDYYQGYFIPKDTIIIPNVWAMLHDPSEYDQPELFNPNRFLKDGAINAQVRDPMIAFGFGRRVCPGRYFALDQAYLVIASILHVFNIEAAVDEHGNKMDPTPEPTPGVLIHPERIACVLRPRSELAKQLVMSSVPADGA